MFFSNRHSFNTICSQSRLLFHWCLRWFYVVNKKIKKEPLLGLHHRERTRKGPSWKISKIRGLSVDLNISKVEEFQGATEITNQLLDPKSVNTSWVWPTNSDITKKHMSCCAQLQTASPCVCLWMAALDIGYWQVPLSRSAKDISAFIISSTPMP